MPRFFRKETAALTVTLLGTVFFPSVAHARHLYLEFGGGLSQIRQSSGFFPTGTPDTLGYGSAFNGTIGCDLSGERPFIHIHMGLQLRLSNGSSGAYFYTLMGAYPILRFEADRYFLGVGYSPVIWRRAATTSGFDQFDRPPSATGYLLEFGHSWVIIPKAEFTLTAAGQAVQFNGALNPKPAVDLTAGLRFYF